MLWRSEFRNTLSGLLNRCLADWIARHSHRGIDAQLAEEYRQGWAEARRATAAFRAVDAEGWPRW